MQKINIRHDLDRYENIFNMYQFTTSNNDTYTFYNILSKISIPGDLDPIVYELYEVDSELPLTTLSHSLYGSQHLWWLIMVLNGIKNPVKLIEAGSIIKIIKNEYLDLVFDSLKNKI
jgi:hypothetical protein